MVGGAHEVDACITRIMAGHIAGSHSLDVGATKHAEINRRIALHPRLFARDAHDAQR